MLKSLWSCIRNTMTAKKKYIVVIGCIIAILTLILIALNVWSVHLSDHNVGFSYLMEDGKTVKFYNGFTIYNFSFFPKEVTVEVYSFRDAAISDGKNSYITEPGLRVESIVKYRVKSIGMQSDEEVMLENPFIMEPLSLYSIGICSTGEYGGYGHAERHPADTVKLSSKFAIEK